MTVSSEAPHKTVSFRLRQKLIVLLCLHIVACCVSLAYVTIYYWGYHFFAFDKAQLLPALLNVVPLVVLSYLFSVARFSFGYLTGFYLYTMMLGYLWLSKFSLLEYDHTLAAISAVVSLMAFLAPALFMTAPIKQRMLLSRTAFDSVLNAILILAVLVIGSGALYNFRIVNIAKIYDFRDQLAFPAPLRYAIGNLSNALLPFAFACFLVRRNGWRAAASLVLLLLLYPITLTKLTLFAPFWLVLLALIAYRFEARIAVILSLFWPYLSGLLLVPLAENGLLSNANFITYFGSINFRMLAVPSLAFDQYNHFFSTHPLTHFCQISFLKLIVNCPYHEPLSLVMSETYQIGAVNASLFATEGIASVGPNLAPLIALACGLVIALANRLSSGLPPRFVLLSGGVLAQTLLNVPLTTSLLSNGAAALFLLWYLTPREFFEIEQASRKEPVARPT